jgi:magnesium transporter
MAETPHWKELAEQLRPILEDKDQDNSKLGELLRKESPEDIALVINELQPEEVDRIFGALNDDCKSDVLSKLDPKLTKEIIQRLELDEFEDIVKKMPERDAEDTLSQAPQGKAEEVIEKHEQTSDVETGAELRMQFPEGRAGRLMTQKFITLSPGMTVEEALELIHTGDKENILSNLYVAESAQQTDSEEKCRQLKGVVSLQDILMADAKSSIDDLMVTDFVTVKGDGDEQDAANLLALHKFLSLPVLDDEGCFIGVIPADDLIRVVMARLHRQYSQAVGADAVAMEEASPLKAAKMRVPWLLLTIILELIAGAVISHFNGILKQVILLASFMPVISAVSGNVGLQAAAITVRGLDTGQAGFSQVGKALFKESATALLMACACGLFLGIIGIVWSKDVVFGVVIAGALACSMLTAGLMGTIIPLISKKLGFDPAATAGPFETAFQDIIGFGVFLFLATTLLRNMH